MLSQRDAEIRVFVPANASGILSEAVAIIERLLEAGYTTDHIQLIARQLKLLAKCEEQRILEDLDSRISEFRIVSRSKIGAQQS